MIYLVNLEWFYFHLILDGAIFSFPPRRKIFTDIPELEHQKLMTLNSQHLSFSSLGFWCYIVKSDLKNARVNNC